ncbi:MAG: hypothetical protein COV44_05920 [Deltaproteobacteria bacterium CG11_big_fil_rev_8_21_14_0_20_45_16]|nr:MAG: hypothetical protein COV44_05920 [Deltaproteobacteria bacterium CG11_big_fil_rev_8_21_14_0_20_45_16]
MPRTVKLKILAITLLSVGILIVLYGIHLWLGLLGSIFGLYYLYTILPSWNLFAKSITNVRSLGPNKVAVTFDDGPSLWTAKILDVLKTEDIKASFFVLGKNIERYPEITRRILSEGHCLGHHAYRHQKLRWRWLSQIRKEYDELTKVMASLQLKPDPLIRFPHGFKNPFCEWEARRRGWTICAWGRGVWDSRRPGVDVIVERSLKLKPGEILLLHDGDGDKENPDREQTYLALEKIIKGLKARGLEFVSLGEMPRCRN